MKYLKDDDIEEIKEFFEESIKEALKSSCLRSKCGCVIVKDNKIIGRGFNSPPNELESQRRCLKSKEDYDKKVTDKTCCVHAEQRAMFGALKNNFNLIDSRLYFIRVNEKGDKIFAGNPHCTICSKMALDLGISEFVLWHEKGICIYDLKEYNSLSFNYNRDNLE